MSEIENNEDSIPAPADPLLADPSMADSSPADTSPADPTPTDSTPTDPRPTDPRPTDHTPTDPTPTDPTPTDPTPTDPASASGDQEVMAMSDAQQDVAVTSTHSDKDNASDGAGENAETQKSSDVETEDGAKTSSDPDETVPPQQNGSGAATTVIDAAALSTTDNAGVKLAAVSNAATGKPSTKVDEDSKVDDPMIEDESPSKREGGTKAEDPPVKDNPVKDGLHGAADKTQKLHLISNENSTSEEVSWRDTKALSISAGNTHIQWAFHSAPKEGYAPILFWRTPHLPDREGGRNKDSQVLNDFLEITKDPSRATETLTRHLPDNVQAYIFGDPEEEHSDLKKLPNVKIYVVSTSPHQLDALEKVWNQANCHCEFEVMSGDQFFSLDDGAYKTMGADRLATLKGAIDLYGLPALVVDGGTAMTYTAADSSGRVMGGGISPGLKLRMESLHNCTAALPFISPEEAYYRVMGEISGNKDSPANVALLAKPPHPLPMDLFACTTEDAMLVSSFGDVGTWLRRCIGGWLHVVGTGKGKKGGRAKKKPQDAMDVLTTGKKTNNDRYVLFTGGDAEILMRMTGKSGEVIRVGSANRKVINKGAGKLDSVVVTADVETLEQCQLVSRNNLVHYGVSRVLKDEYYKKFAKSDKESKLGGLDIENLHSMIGTRVAKRFAALNADGTHFFRGVVNEIYPDDGGDLLFGVTYDDGDREHLNLEELHEAVKLILEVGELGQKPKRESISAKKRPKSPGKDVSRTKKVRTKSPGEKAEAKTTPSAKKEDLLPSDLKKSVGLRVAKYFDKDLYFGSIDAAHQDTEAECGFFFHVTYDDGDQEDLDMSELTDSRRLYSRKQSKDPNPDYIAPASTLKKKSHGESSK